MNHGELLTHEGAKLYYDRLGSLLDTQAFYELAAVSDLAQHLGLRTCKTVAEFGCGTGRFAAELFEQYLPEETSYLGIDSSNTMVELARKRLSRYGRRAEILQSDGSMRIDRPNESFDCVVCTYVLDLLSSEDVTAFLQEAHRTLKNGGHLGLVSLTAGSTVFSGTLSTIWSHMHKLSPWLVGGCRPIKIAPLLAADNWRIDYGNIVTRYGVPSEIVVAAKTIAS